jgi:TolB protein
MFLCTAANAEGERNTSDQPWWKQKKIRYFWGQWNRYQSEINQDPRGEPHVHGPDVLNPAKYLKETETLIKNLGDVGATVFVRYRPGYLAGPMYEENQARMAREHGMRYFGIIYLHTFAAEAKLFCPDRRISVDSEGKPYGHEVYGLLPCPLYEPAYRKWLFEPTLDAARSGLVDGLQMEWEPYGVRSEARLCFCDDCFQTFLSGQGETLEDLPPKDQRHGWLEQGDHLEGFNDLFAERRAEMFRGFAEEVRAIKPDFIFAGYDMLQWAPEIAPGLHHPDAPFFHIDNRHQSEAHNRTWWQSLHTYCKKHGYIRIGGTNGHILFGGQPYTAVSASKILYELAIAASDGYWVWLEQELTPDTWRTFWLANRMVQATEQKVGDFLLQGEPDTRFASVVEWSGDPVFDDMIVQRTYRLNDRHLLHVNNVHTDWPVRLRLRFPRLPAGSKWIVSDPIVEATYVRERRQAVWTAERLAEGIVASLPKRSELFVELNPTSQEEIVASGSVLFTDEGETMPPHPVGEPFTPSSESDDDKPSLAVTVTERMGYDGSDGWTIGNAIHTIGADGGETKRLRQVKGYLWSPSFSPDGQKIAFVHDTNGRGQIYVLDPDHAGSRWTYNSSSAVAPTLPDGSRWVNLSNNDYCDRNPVWSPDGKRIAFVSDRDGDWNVYVMDADGGNQRRLTDDPGQDSQPVWSSNGKRIAFCRDMGDDVDLLVINADGTDEKVVVRYLDDVWDPAWSPDGGRIACIGVDSPNENALLVVDLATGKVKKVLRMASLRGPAWSADGKHVAGVHGGGQKPDDTGVFLVDVDSYAPGFNVWGLVGGLKEEKNRLASAPSVRSYSADPPRDWTRASWYSKGGGSPRWVVKTFSSVKWSPDGKQVAFSSDMSEDGYFYVYLAPAAGGGKPKRLDATRSAWPNQIDWRP